MIKKLPLLLRPFSKKNDPGGDRFHCLVTMYGIPLRVLPPKLTSEEQKKVLELQKRLESIRDQIKNQERQRNDEELKSLREEGTKLKKGN